MNSINVKYTVLIKALDSLDEARMFSEKIKKTPEELFKIAEYDVMYRISRDSLIRRFEFSIELLWKYLRIFLEMKQIQLNTNTPGDVIRSACNARILNEKEAEYFLDMIKSRNLTSHIYKEDIAEQLAKIIPVYYKQMRTFADYLRPE